jgi:peptidylprolyl isomerase
VPSGAISDAVTVEGGSDDVPTVAFETPLEVTSAERTVVVEGDGEQLVEGDLVTYRQTLFDASTGEQVYTAGFDEDLLPVAVAIGTGADQFFGCATIGSRIVMVLPESGGAPAAVMVLDVTGTTPTAAWGESQDPVDGMPAVELAEDGTPTITVDTGAAPPAETEVAILKKGDGSTVQSGDTVLIQFRGARWSTGELFDGGDTWATNSPYTGATTGFVPGFREALEDQTVGSQVLVVITPADGYGEGQINADDLVGETLVFVVDILAVQPAVTE